MPPPLSLYIHLPWCVAKCPYCDFNSHRAGDAPPRGRYVEALGRELSARAPAAAGRAIETVFIGGGTPSLFTGSEIRDILQAARSEFDLVPGAEITMEANPGTVERGQPAACREAGINRLSLGAQSFDPDALRRLGRIHGPAEIGSAFAEARAAGFTNINLDLMFALPGQTLAAARDDVERALALAPEHISYYQLTLEPNTVFHSRPPAELPDDELAWEIQEQGFQLLAKAGYERYEISAFARAGRACRHNLNYWTFGDYLAVGAGAHGKLTDTAGRVWRYQNPAHPVGYIESTATGTPASGAESAADERVFEFMLNALRLPGGFTEACFAERTGLGWGLVRDRADALRHKGLIEKVGLRWRPTELGLRFLNDLQAAFLPPA
ncbi:MAG: radical SAM family heme chaperone HemW [Gammaproteobacteria bacterium]|nr:radical SAM family heme chaperone HemW [Gammaproteobacteria bacterium]MDH5311408.1 radical SAM family heme chaperone HemW [Gammaproteobacteria bacterium]